MNTTFMNSKNNKTSDSHRLLHNLRDKIIHKYVAWSNSIHCAWDNIKKVIQYYFECIFKKKQRKEC